MVRPFKSPRPLFSNGQRGDAAFRFCLYILSAPSHYLLFSGDLQHWILSLTCSQAATSVIGPLIHSH